MVTKLIRGAPSDKCGLILEGDHLISVDGRSISALRFSEVSALLSGPQGVPVAMTFQRTVSEVPEARARTYDVALRRERFYLPELARGVPVGTRLMSLHCTRVARRASLHCTRVCTADPTPAAAAAAAAARGRARR